MSSSSAGPPVLPSNRPYCAGLDKDGNACRCQRYVPKKKDKCGCKHKDFLHTADEPIPLPSTGGSDLGVVASIVDQYSVKLPRLRLPEKADEAEARREANAGFRKVDDVAVDGAWEGHRPQGNDTRFKKVRGAKKVVKVTLKPKAQASRGIKVGMVLLMPYGLKSSGKVRREEVPTPEIIENGQKGRKSYQEAGLVVDREGDGMPTFHREWSAEAIDSWLRKLFPQPFRYLDVRYGRPRDGEYHWGLLGRHYGKFISIRRPAINGSDLARQRGTGLPPEKMTLYFTTSHLIPLSVLQDWDAATDMARHRLPEAISPTEDIGEETTEEENSDSSSNNEGSPERPRPRPAYKGKGKGKEADPETPSESSDSDSGSEGTQESEFTAHIKAAAHQERKSERLVAKRGRMPASDSEVEIVEVKRSRTDEEPSDGLDPFADKEAYLEYPGFELFGGGSFSGGTGPIGAQALSGDEFGYSGGKTLASPGKPKRSPWTKD